MLLAGLFAPVWGCGLLAQMFDALSGQTSLAPDKTAGAVQVHLDNQSGFRASVIAEYWIDDVQVRKTELVLDAEGIGSQDDILPTTTKLLKILAVVVEPLPTSMPTTQPASQSTSAVADSNPADVEPGDTLLDVELHWMHDFFDGTQLTVVIPPPGPAAADFVDCNRNGAADSDDIAAGRSRDCNCNDVPDECDIATATLHDVAPADGVPDECVANCPPLDVVIILNTRGSIAEEASGLCVAIDQVAQAVQQLGLSVRTTALGVTTRPSKGLECVGDDVVHLLGAEVPGEAPCCSRIQSDGDWGPAAAVVAARFAWSEGAARVIIPISNEAPLAGDPCNNPGDDAEAIELAISVAKDHHARVFPVLGSSTLPCTIDLAMRLALQTGGISFATTGSEQDWSRALQSALLLACSVSHDCGSN
jgi:hypothetical protein